MRTVLAPSLLLLLLLALAVREGAAATWDEERLQWLVVTKPSAQRVMLNCTSEHIYPFSLLANDSSEIGALGGRVKRVWWQLPNGHVANENYHDGKRNVTDKGRVLIVQNVDENMHGLYHCCIEANVMINETEIDRNRTKIYYYKRGLNLYGADIYGGNQWEKYKRNTLIGSLTAGIFLALIAGYALLDHFGVLAKCSRSNEVRPNSTTVEAAEMNVPAVAAPDENANENADENADENAKKQPATSQPHSSASLRSRRGERETAVVTAAV